jgi:exodeoxyribonuclease VII large subunit
MNPTPGQGEIWSVSRLVQKLKLLFVQEVPPTWIEGEISNYSRSGAGHRYFTLKDEQNQLKAALFRGRSGGLKFEPADGQKVVAFGRVDIYGPRSEYQLIVEQMLPAGLGELELAFKQLYERLKQEGLFEAARKQPLPLFPRRLGIVTSARGAAVRDILQTLRRRAPHVEAVIADTLVQGDQAAGQMVSAIQDLNRLGTVDLILLARGGGSLEDLWPFNEEVVVRAIVASRLPVVAGIGHEVDTTLSDLAADVRAATPTAAAEVAVRSAAEWRTLIHQVGSRLGSEVALVVSEGRTQIKSLSQRYGFKRPGEVLRTYMQVVDGFTQRIRHAAPARWAALRDRAYYLSTRPAIQRPESWFNGAKQRLVHLGPRLITAWKPVVGSGKERMARASGGLEALSPRSVLDRGYAVLMSASGKVISSVADAQENSALTAVVRDGQFQTRVEGKERDATWP